MASSTPLSAKGEKKELPDPMEAMASIQRTFGEHGGVNVSVVSSASFRALDPDTIRKTAAGELQPQDGYYIYSRAYNPTVLQLSRHIAALEGTEAAYCTASGMAAVSGVLLQLCSSGDHIVASSRLYGGTHALLDKFLPRIGNITTSFIDILDHDEVRTAITPSTKILYFESMSNPTCTVADIPLLSAIAHNHNLTVVVDNTFAPTILSPARLGADVVIHSLTKFMSGSADVIAGAVCGPGELIRALMSLKDAGSFTTLGPTIDPTVASKILLRLPHLGLRMQEQSRRALEFATRLQTQGARVTYPGLEQHPQHHLLKQLMNPGYGYGGVLGVDMGTAKTADDFMRSLHKHSGCAVMATSFGYHDTLVCRPAATSSSDLGQKLLETIGISPGYVRVSVGFTGSLEQRWNQFEEAIRALKLTC